MKVYVVLLNVPHETYDQLEGVFASADAARNWLLSRHPELKPAKNTDRLFRDSWNSRYTIEPREIPVKPLQWEWVRGSFDYPAAAKTMLGEYKVELSATKGPGVFRPVLEETYIGTGCETLEDAKSVCQKHFAEQVAAKYAELNQELLA